MTYHGLEDFDFFIYKKQSSPYIKKMRNEFGFTKSRLTQYLAEEDVLTPYLTKEELKVAIHEGKPPIGKLEFHHAHLLSGGGTNNPDNIKVIIKNEQMTHKRLHNIYDPFVENLKVGESVALPYLGFDSKQMVFTQPTKEMGIYVCGVHSLLFNFLWNENIDFSTLYSSKHFKQFKSLKQGQVQLMSQLDSKTPQANANYFHEGLEVFAHCNPFEAVFGDKLGPWEQSGRKTDLTAFALQTSLMALLLADRRPCLSR